MTTSSTSAPVRREIRVGCDVDTAFELFTAHIGAWWPLRTHGVFGERASVAFEDGRLVERLGSRHAVWGSVVQWNRPNGFRITWHPGHGPERATEVAVDFARHGDATLVTLTHTGWDRLAEPDVTRSRYERDWAGVLSGYVVLVDGEDVAPAVDPKSPGTSDALTEAPDLAHVTSMWADDEASRHLGMLAEVVEVDHAVVRMPVTDVMVNGHDIVHGGYIFTLADSTFALACNSRGALTVAAGADITFIASARRGDVLVADARQRTAYGRSGLTDVTVTRESDGALIAEFRGRSRSLSPR